MSKPVIKYSSFEAFQKEQSKSNRLLYVYHDTVYDLTDFINKHPGGKGPLQQYKGKDLENIFFNPSIHKHSKNALQVLGNYKCGVIEKQQQPSILQSKSTAVTQSNFSQKPIEAKTQPIKKQALKSQSVKPSQSEDRLNQSMSKLNQSMTSSVRSQFLHIPSQQEIQQMQKIKQKQMLTQWKQEEINELKRQQAEVLGMQKEKSGKQEDRKVQSEIIAVKKKQINPYYQAWLDQQQQQNNNILPKELTNQSTDQSVSKLCESVIVQKVQKKVNPYYEEWKKKQALMKEQQMKQEQSIIIEENESQLSAQPSSVNNSFCRSFSQFSQRTIVQEDPHLFVPVFSPKFISPLKAKFISSEERFKV